MSDGWVETAFQIPASLVDQLSEILFELSGTGVCIDNQTLDTFSLDTLSEPTVATVRAYFANDSELNRKIREASRIVANLCDGQSDFIYSPPVLNQVCQEDWATSWKQYFHPSPVGRRLLLKPSWEELDSKEERIIIEIDPGMAFGTGTHATTRLCLETLERILDHVPPFENALPDHPPTILDVGTGSGVLAIAARKLGSGRIAALDIDPEAVQVALDNLHNNNIFDDIEISTTPLDQISGSFSIVLANILAEDLIRMAPSLSSKLMTGGFMILSGILIERESGVKSAFSACGLVHIETTQEQEWSCIVFLRNR
jgi:ribosomal protein L11 methyltransferase